VILASGLLFVLCRYMWVKRELHSNSHQENVVATYVPFQDLAAGPGTPIDIVVTKTTSVKENTLHVTFRIPVNSETINRPPNQILVYGYKKLGGTKTDDVPEGTFEERHGSWQAGDRIVLDIRVPKQFSDGSAGRVVRIGVGDDKEYYPSPNLLVGDALK
jgi:hypothetical protein